MTNLFLLKLIEELIKNDKPTPEEIRCARTIIQSLIKFNDESPILINKVIEDYSDRTCSICRGYDSHSTDCPNKDLNKEAQQAMEELQ